MRKPKAGYDIIGHIRDGGLQNEIAKAIGKTRQAVSQWSEVPWNRVLVVEKITGVPRHLIRPDIYPPEDYERLGKRGRPTLVA